MVTRRLQVLRWTGSFVFLLWTAANTCHGQGAIHSVSLNMDGLLNITTNRSTDTVALVCRVTYSNVNRTTFFYLNGTVLKGTHQLEMDRTIRVSQYKDCFNPPLSQDELCEELTLVFRTDAAINNSEFTCRSRGRINDTPMPQVLSDERVTVILRHPDTEEADSCSPPSPSPSPSPSPPPLRVSPTPTPQEPPPDVNTDPNTSLNVIPEGREGIYLIALGAETLLLIVAIFLCIFLSWRLHKKRKNHSVTVDLERPVNPLVFEDSEDTKATIRPSYTTQTHTQPEVKREENVYTTERISDV